MGTAFPTLLNSHLLPTDTASSLANDDFEEFLQWRQDAIWERIQEVTGVSVASDLLIDEPEEPFA